jgi:uncharacterized protein (DUF433 family)
MSLQIHAEPALLRIDADGAVRVGMTRVTLNTIVAAFHQGMSAEEIADCYPSLTLADVYGAISYYLRHRSMLDPYLEQQCAQAEQLREKIRRLQQPHELKDRLLARLHHREH